MWMRTDFMRKERQVNDVTRAIHVLQDSLYDGMWSCLHLSLQGSLVQLGSGVTR